MRNLDAKYENAVLAEKIFKDLFTFVWKKSALCASSSVISRHAADTHF
jgi:hypothetical protein